MTTEQMLLKGALIEINGLRRRNEVMVARLEMFDNMMLIFNATPSRQGGLMSPDIAWEINQHLETLEKQNQQ